MNKQTRFWGSLKILNHRKTAIVSLTLAVLLLAPAMPALALETGLQYGTITGLGTIDIRVTIMQIVRILLGLVGIIAIILTIYAGFLWMTSAGNEEAIKKAKAILRNAVIGLIIIFSAFAIVSFIIAMLTGGFGPGPGPGPLPPPGGCENCGHLGGGIIESVYPAPLARDVPRDTEIIVTFKETMQPDTVINNAPAACTTVSPCTGDIAVGNDGEPNVKIYKQADGEGGTLAATAVSATSQDGKTFVFRPSQPLGDSNAMHWYATKLTNKIIRANGDLAFPGAGDYFAWNFEIGRKLDLVPPQISTVFPPPDSDADDYTKTAAKPAWGRIKAVKQPKIDQDAAASLAKVVGPADPDTGAAMTGKYNGKYHGTIELTVNAGHAAITAAWINTTDPYNEGSKTLTLDANRRVDLGNGLSVVYSEQIADGWKHILAVVPQTNADVLQVSNLTYKFVRADLTAGPTEINISNTGLAELTNNIAGKVFATPSNQNPKVLANEAADANGGCGVGSGGVLQSGSEYFVCLKAELGGTAGNNINIAATGDWAQITPMHAGSNETLEAECRGKCDQPKNSVIRLDFNEAVDPTAVAGRVATDNPAIGAENLAVDDFRNITVQADLDASNTFDDDEYVSGTFNKGGSSNQYKTVEFISLRQCRDKDGNLIVNSCGDKVYCLPVKADADYTLYRVTVKAANLKTCTASAQCAGLAYDDGTRTESCLDIPLGAAAPGTPSPVCGNDAGQYFMKANDPGQGVIDTANNSFDGNRNGLAQGGILQGLTPAYYLNLPTMAKRCDQESGAAAGVNCTNDSGLCGASTRCRDAGDDLVFTFYVKNQVDLNAPLMLNIAPKIHGQGQSLISPINSTFNKLLMSSTVKPGTGYLDGKCTCAVSADCPDADQACLNFLCVNQNNDQVFCGKDADCKAPQTCQTRKYVTLYDKTTRPVGWWVSNVGQDINMCLNEDLRFKECVSAADCGGNTCSEKDDYADRSLVLINHTYFLESTLYSAENASGIQDIYQNCFIPGLGPVLDTCNPYTGSGCCGVSASGNAYCCNGEPSPTACTP